LLLSSGKIRQNYTSAHKNKLWGWMRLPRATVAHHLQFGHVQGEVLITSLRRLTLLALPFRRLRPGRWMPGNADHMEHVLGQVHLLAGELPGSSLLVGDVVASRRGVLL